MKLKHLFWWVAGADIDRLQRCPTDQKRMGAIGMVILTTSFVAFVAGTAAAMFFTQKDGDTTGNLGWSIAFGVLWAIIIFMIDRSLVLTMKKDPTKKNQFRALAGPFIFRMFLAAIIALMISIPLELFIFEGFISVQEKRYAAKEANEYAELTQESRKIQALDSLNNRTQGMIDENKNSIIRYDSLINIHNNQISSLKLKLNAPNTPRYKETHSQIQKKQQELEKVRGSRAAENKTSQLIKEIARLKTIEQEEVRTWNNKINSEIQKLEEESNATKEERNKLRNENVSARKRIVERDSIRYVAQKISDVETADFRDRQKNASRFLRDYQILSNTVVEKDAEGHYVYPTELFFYWLIRMIFFLIELLPTLVKVITPIGAYDKLVYEEEKALQDYFGSEEYRNSLLVQEKAEQQRVFKRKQQRQTIEENAHLEILKQANQAQNEVAIETIRRWKQQELDKLHLNTEFKTDKNENND